MLTPGGATANFLAALRGEAPVACSFADAVISTAIVEQAFASARSGGEWRPLGDLRVANFEIDNGRHQAHAHHSGCLCSFETLDVGHDRSRGSAFHPSNGTDAPALAQSEDRRVKWRISPAV